MATEPLQLTVDGREEPAREPVQPETHEVVRLFDAPTSIRGQLAIDESDPEGSIMRSI
jgi:hypothetical protein